MKCNQGSQPCRNLVIGCWILIIGYSIQVYSGLAPKFSSRYKCSTSFFAGLWITVLYSPTPRHSAHTVAPSRSAPYHNGRIQFHGWVGVHLWYRQRCSAILHHKQTLHDIPDIPACPARVPPGRCRRGIQCTVFGA